MENDCTYSHEHFVIGVGQQYLCELMIWISFSTIGAESKSDRTCVYQNIFAIAEHFSRLGK